MAESKLSVEDRFEIYDLLGRLAWTFDTGDLDGIVACFAPDGVMTMGNGERFEGPERLREMAVVATAGDRGKNRQHFNKHLYVYPDGDGWTVRSYMQILHVKPDTDEKIIRTLSYSEDTCVKTPDGWRIKERRNGPWVGDSIPWVGD